MLDALARVGCKHLFADFFRTTGGQGARLRELKRRLLSWRHPPGVGARTVAVYGASRSGEIPRGLAAIVSRCEIGETPGLTLTPNSRPPACDDGVAGEFVSMGGLLVSR